MSNTTTQPFWRYFVRFALSEADGSPSSIRICMALMAGVSALVVVTWLGLSVHAHFAGKHVGLLDFPVTALAAVGTLSGVFAGAKVAQYGQEVKP